MDKELEALERVEAQRQGNTGQITEAPREKSSVLGIISIILGGVSLLPALGIASIAGVVVGAAALIRERNVTGIVGLVLSVAGIATSPTVWALAFSLWIRVDCAIVDCPTKLANTLVKVMNDPGLQRNIEKIVSQGVSDRFSVALPPEWNKVDGTAPSIYAGTDGFFSKQYWTAPNFKAVMLETLGDKDRQESIQAFINRFIQEHLKAKNPHLQAVPMDNIKIRNSGDADKNEARLFRFSETSLGDQEFVAYIDGGPKVLMFIVAAPTNEDLKAAWPVFYNSLVNGVNFHVSAPAVAEPAVTANGAVPDIPSSSVVQIPIHEMMEFNFKSKQEIYDLRRGFAAEYPQFIDSGYSPAEDIFGQIQDGKPWWGILGKSYYGNGQQSILGPAEESRFIANPLLLVGLDSGHAVRVNNPNSQPRPIYPVPLNLYWSPDRTQAGVKYDVTSFFEGERPEKHLVTLVAYNAKDLGWRYLYVSPEQSKNVTAASRPVQILQFIHTGSSCGYSGGCNNMSPHQEEMVIKIDQLPARAYIKLWKNAPADLSVPADMVFIMDMI